jgi:hypothetical protein
MFGSRPTARKALTARQGKPEARVHVHENDIQRVKISLQCSSGLSRCLRVVKIQ